MSIMETVVISGGNEEKRRREIEKIISQKKPQFRASDPDFLSIASAKEIGIEEIRNLKYWLSLKAYNQPPKIAVIEKAETLTNEAQMMLGQFLEVEMGKCLLILETVNADLLNSGITAKSQQIKLGQESTIVLSQAEEKKEREQLEAILKMKGNERLKFTEKFKEREEAIVFCQKQLILWRLVLLQNPTRQNYQVIKEIQKTIKYLNANVNVRLALDNLLLSYPGKSHL